MSQKIIVFSGTKQSGKTSAKNEIVGYLMQHFEKTSKYYLNNAGELCIATDQGMGVFDLESHDDQIVDVLKTHVWLYVKSYSFADHLKWIAMDVFGLTHNQCFGTEADKNSLTSIKWLDIIFIVPPRTGGKIKKQLKMPDDHPEKLNEYMTAREFLQTFGTDICRKIKPNCWVEACYRQIINDGVPLAIITDCRFKNEFEFSQQVGAKVIRFNRQIDGDTHRSETDLDDVPSETFDAYIDNTDMSLVDKNNSVKERLFEWGYLPVEMLT